MSEVRDDRRYTKSHEWARPDADGTVTVGISDYAQEALGDLVYVEPPAAGSTLEAKAQAGIVESVKAASDIHAPLSGTVTEVNANLEEKPESLNLSPYDEGWIFRMQPSLPQETAMASLMDAQQYEAFCQGS